MSTIGELKEGSLHRALKARYTAAGSETERTIDGYVADVVSGGRIIEIQTGGFGPLRAKLECLLHAHPVTLVYPVARDRYIVRLTEAGDQASRRKSPRHGTLFDVFSPLVSIPALLAHPNLTLHVVITVEEEVRAPTARRSRRRGPWTRVDRRLVDVVETHPIASMATLFALLDAALPGEFTTLDLAAAMKSTRPLAQQAAYCFRESGVTEISGKTGNALVYRRAG